MAVKVTLLLKWGRQAWSESHYWLGGNVPDKAEGPANVLAFRRSKLLAQDAYVYAARISDLVNPGHADLVTYDPPYQGQAFNINFGFVSSVPVPGAGLANEAALIDAGGDFADSFYHSRPALAAIPYGLVQSVNGVPFVNVAACPAWLSAFNSYSSLLLDTTWGFNIKTEGTKYSVLSIGGGNGIQVSLTTSVLFSPQPQDLIHVRGFRSHPTTRQRLAGLWRVDHVSVHAPIDGKADVFLYGSDTLPAASAFKLPGTVQSTGGLVIPYTRYNVDTGSTRKRGGSIGLPRGRSRTRV